MMHCDIEVEPAGLDMPLGQGWHVSLHPEQQLL